MLNRRKVLGGLLPQRKTSSLKLTPDAKVFNDFMQPSDREQSTTMVFVRLLTKLLRDKNIGKNIIE